MKMLRLLRPSLALKLTSRCHIVTNPLRASLVTRKFGSHGISGQNGVKNGNKNGNKNGKDELQDATSDASDSNTSETASVWKRIWSFMIKPETIFSAFTSVVSLVIALGLFKHHLESTVNKAFGVGESYKRGELIASQKMQIEKREKLFVMGPPLHIDDKMPRKRKEANWRYLIYKSLFGSPLIYWIYGNKAVGKSTMLQQCTYDLQMELLSGKVADMNKYDWAKMEDASKFKVLYINFESKAEEEDVTPHNLVKALEGQIAANKKAGIKSLVVVDSIGPMFGRGKFQEDMTFEKFQTAIDSVEDYIPDWTVRFFRFVKGMVDSQAASFVFVTSKPLHYVAELEEIKHFIGKRSKNVDIDSEEYKHLSLDLTDEEIRAYVKVRKPLLTDKEIEALLRKFKKMETPTDKINQIGYLRVLTA